MGYLKFEIRLEIKLNFYMDQFVKAFTKNPQKWRSRLTADQLEKIQTFVNNIADVTPKTDKLALEARIIARRHPHIAVVNDDEDDEEEADELIWPDRKINNIMLFFKWMWMNNRDVMIKKYMTSEYHASGLMEIVRQQIGSCEPASEARCIWNNHIQDIKYKLLKNAIKVLFHKHDLLCKLFKTEAQEESDSDGESPVVRSAIKGKVKSRAKKAVPVAQESESEEEPVEVIPVKKSASKVQHDSEGEEIYSDEAHYESEESEEVVEKNNDYIPKADSESE